MLQNKEKKIVESCALSLLEAYKRDKATLKAVFNSLSKLRILLTDSPLREIFYNPLFEDEDKFSAIEVLKLPLEVDRFLKILVETQNIRYIMEIIAAYEDLFLEETRHMKVVLTLAKKELLTSAPIKSLKGKLEKLFDKKIEIVYKIDDHIYGGFTLMAGSFYMDASLRGRIDQLQRYGMEN